MKKFGCLCFFVVINILFLSGCNLLLGLGSGSEPVTYNVYHLIENIDDPGYSELEDSRETLSGYVGNKTTVNPKTIDGFTVQDFEQNTLKKNSNNDIFIYYKRNIITITFDLGEDSIFVDGKYESTVWIPEDPIKEGYLFAGWNIAIPEKFPSSDLLIKAKWEKVTESSYTVEHYFMTRDGNDYVISYADTEVKQGTIGQLTEATSKTGKTGFTPEEIEQKVIEGSETIVKVYYKRNKYSVFYDANGGSGIMEPNYIFFENFKNLTKNNFTRDCYYFAGWNTKPDGTGTSYDDTALFTVLNAEDTTLYAQWLPNKGFVTITLPDNEDGKLDVNLTSSWEDGKVTFMVAEMKGAEYLWYLDSKLLPVQNRNVLEINTSEMIGGKYEIMVVVIKNNSIQSAKAILVFEN